MADNSTGQTIREAMSRLLGGQSILTNRRLTISNLAREAGVSRATVNRYTNILSDFRHAVQTLTEKAAVGRISEDGGNSPVQHVVAQHTQARAILRQQNARRASYADVVIFPRQKK